MRKWVEKWYLWVKEGERRVENGWKRPIIRLDPILFISKCIFKETHIVHDNSSCIHLSLEFRVAASLLQDEENSRINNGDQVIP